MAIEQNGTVATATQKKQLPALLEEFRQALEEEIEAIEKDGLSSTLLRSGMLIKHDGSSWWYEFTVEYLPSMPADTPCKLIIGKDTFEVTVINVTDQTIVVASSTILPPSMEQARLENGSTVLMERLIKRIEENAEKENPAAKRLLDYSDPSMPACFQQIFHIKDDQLELNEHNNSPQTDAVRSALTNDVTFIWGPPGTGKTSVIAQIIHNLYRSNRSVLLISHTNTAVDGAIKKVDEKYGNSYPASPYPLLRLGQTVQELPDRLGLEWHVRERRDNIHSRVIRLEEQRQYHHLRLDEIDTIFRQNDWLKNNELNKAKNYLDEIDCLIREQFEIKNKITEVQEKIKHLEEIHPDYEMYKALFSRIVIEREQCELYKQKALKPINALRLFPKRLAAAQAAVNAHNKRNQLQLTASNYPSIDSLKSQLQSLELEIEELEHQEKNDQVKIINLKKTIERNERVSFLVKPFIDKEYVVKKRLSLEKTEQHMERVMQQQLLKLREYDHVKRQLNELLLLEQQINDIVVTETKDFWLSELSNLKTTEHKLREEASELTEEYKQSKECLEQTEKAIEGVQSIQAEMDEALMLHQQLLSRSTTLQNQIKKNTSDCITVLQRELKCIRTWDKSIPIIETEAGIRSAFQELLDLEKKYHKRISAMALNELENEKQLQKEMLAVINQELDAMLCREEDFNSTCILQAGVIGTSLAEFCLNDMLFKRSFDTVIFDETSEMNLPALWCACLLAEKNIVLITDSLEALTRCVSARSTSQ